MSFPQRIGKPCAHCGVVFRPQQRYALAKFCGRACAAAARPRASRVAAGRKGGGKRAEHLWARIDALTVREAYRLGRTHQRAAVGNRVQAAKREGFSTGYEQGYEAALRESRRAA